MNRSSGRKITATFQENKKDEGASKPKQINKAGLVHSYMDKKPQQTKISFPTKRQSPTKKQPKAGFVNPALTALERQATGSEVTKGKENKPPVCTKESTERSQQARVKLDVIPKPQHPVGVNPMPMAADAIQRAILPPRPTTCIDNGLTKSVHIEPIKASSINPGSNSNSQRAEQCKTHSGAIGRPSTVIHHQQSTILSMGVFRSQHHPEYFSFGDGTNEPEPELLELDDDERSPRVNQTQKVVWLAAGHSDDMLLPGDGLGDDLLPPNSTEKKRKGDASGKNSCRSKKLRLGANQFQPALNIFENQDDHASDFLQRWRRFRESTAADISLAKTENDGRKENQAPQRAPVPTCGIIISRLKHIGHSGPMQEKPQTSTISGKQENPAIMKDVRNEFSSVGSAETKVGEGYAKVEDVHGTTAKENNPVSAVVTGAGDDLPFQFTMPNEDQITDEDLLTFAVEIEKSRGSLTCTLGNDL